MSEKLKILIVDDNKEFCQNVGDILELRDYEVMAAHNGFKALEMTEQNDFALVLMDVKMPVMDGVATFKKMKEMMPDTPVIMVTAYAIEELIREALREGAFGSLKKPLDFDKLFILIESAVSKGALALVVDDDENLCANMEDILNDKGYRVSVAYDGGTAIQKARENNFDLMLIDLKLPPLNGLETYLSIRDIRPNAAVIIITGYPKEMAGLARQALQKGAYICLEKPIDMDDLLSLIGQIEEQKDKGTLQKPE